MSYALGCCLQHTPLDLDMLVNGLVDEVDELDVSDFNGGATEVRTGTDWACLDRCLNSTPVAVRAM